MSFLPLLTYFCLYSCGFSRISYEWNYSLGIFLFLSLGITLLRFTHIVHISEDDTIMSTVPFYCWIVFLVWIHQDLFLHLSNIGMVSTFWLLCIMLLWSFAYRFLCEYVFSFLLGKYLKVKWWGHVVTVYTFKENAKLMFQTDKTISHCYQQFMTVSDDLCKCLLAPGVDFSPCHFGHFDRCIAVSYTHLRAHETS